MNYPTYPEYKESGVQWLGEVPEGWEIMPLKWRTRTKSGDGISPSDVSPEQGEETCIPVIGGNGIMGYCSSINVSSPILVIGRVGALCGNVHEIYYPAWITDNALILTVQKKSFDLRYLASVLRTRNLNEIADKTAQPLITGTKVRAESSPMPPFEEQTAIADFLDRETGRIDTLVAKKRRLVALLKEKRTALISRTVTRGLPESAAREFDLKPHTRFKDSGIEWLDEVPEGWEVWKMSHACSRVLDGTHFSPESAPEGDRLYITAKNIKEWGIDLSNITYVSEADHRAIFSRCPVRKGDVLYIKDGATAGIATVNTISEEFSLLSSVALLRPCESRMASGFLAYQMNTTDFKSYVLNSLVGGAMTRFTLEIIGKFRIIVPLFPEQTAITTYLDRETAKIDRLVEKVEVAIARLQEYRTALITAAVTGKIDVREALV
jgi:type I restriction enzyme S subunit